MRQIEVPELQFSPWFSWQNRHMIPLCNKPGIYLLSITRKNLERLSPEWVDVSYIGMTNSCQGLAGRWQQFYNAIRGMTGHSGGNSVFKDLGHYKDWTQKLFVSAMPVDCNVKTPTVQDLIKMGWVAYLEYEAFAKFHHHHHKKPKYNTR